MLAHNRMLSLQSVAAKQDFRQQQRQVKKAVDRAKESWIRKVASEGEAARKDGRMRWGSIRSLQQAHAGRRPVWPNAVRKEDGELTQGEAETLQRWHQHFRNLLNQQS